METLHNDKKYGRWYPVISLIVSTKICVIKAPHMNTAVE